ncbi:SDR family NAD(P)-dependent oxidoreductase [Ferrovum sp.]|jgi:short-subunit dehydrogenase|uniref:SDR family NAD(P)-dependent oxidoreductase n=1 Tax=Ferrovum sp. TaxID=2609467 RepID=UPI00262E150A|nr:SDR family NAD(P)-dependent oxidoreductase [Ferrovum sp.]
MRLLSPLNPPLTKWFNQRVWIIGATRGIGAAVARALAIRNAHLCLSGRDLSGLQEWHDALTPGQKTRTTLTVLDIRDPQNIQEIAQNLLLAWGGIDLILVVAGVYDGICAPDLTLDQMPLIEDTLQTNLLGPYHVLAAVLPLLRRQRYGHLAFVSSVAGYNGLPRALAYAPSKAALNNLCEGLYFELRPHGIGVSRICPGFVATDMTSHADHFMPALMQPDQAAHEILAGLERGDFEIHFPKRFTTLLKIAQWLPRRLYFYLLGRAIARSSR